jgi:hypothetical protein
LTIDIAFRDGLADGKDLVVELVRADGVVIARRDGNSELRLVRNISANDLSKGTRFTVRMTNPQTVRTVRGISLVGKFNPN